MEKTTKIEPRYGLFTAISMVIGQVIGSGIFFKVDDVLSVTQGQVLPGLIGFIIVGVSVVFASIAMSNYAQIIPDKSGIISYVEYRFGHYASAMVGWIYLSLFYPLLTAVLFSVAGIYIANLIGELTGFDPTFTHYSSIAVASSLLFLILNIFSPKKSGIFQQLTTVLKLLPLIFIASLGIFTLFNEVGIQNSPAIARVFSFSGEENFLLLLAASFIPIAFAFDGWYIATQISSEVKNAKKNLPRALVIGTTIVLTVYVCYYLGITSRMDALKIIALEDNYIREFARSITQNSGALVIQLFIIISVLGTANGLLLATLRVPYQFYQLKSSRKFFHLGKINPRTQMPLNSAILAYLLVIFYLFLFYLTSTHPFFTSKKFDISAIPIAFIYIVNGALFIGLFPLIRKKIIPNNTIRHYLITFLALFGILVVLLGTMISNNGMFYVLVSIAYMLFGTFFIKRLNK